MASDDTIKLAFCIGNGISRKQFDLNILKNYGPTYGCNNLILDFDLDNTIIVDRSLLIDMISQNVPERTNLYTRKRWETTIPNVKIFYLPTPIENIQQRWDNEIHWGSGMHALNLAATHGAEIIVMLGYDIWTGNIYGNDAIDPSCWIYQGKRCFDLYPDIQFVQIQPTNWKIPDQWKKIENFSIDNFKGLQSFIGC